MAILALTEACRRISALSTGDLDGLAGAVAMIEEVEPVSTVQARLLDEAVIALRAVMSGAAADPRATLSSALRFLDTAALIGASGAGAGLAAEDASERVSSEPDAPAAFSIDEDDRELVSEFVTESLDYLAQAEAAMLVLETHPEDAEAVDTIFRAFHTVKGVSAMLGLGPISALAHRAESLLTKVRSRELPFSGDVSDLSLAAVDALKALVDGAAAAIAGEPWTSPVGLEKLAEGLASATGLRLDPRSTVQTEDAGGPEGGGGVGGTRRAPAEARARGDGPTPALAGTAPRTDAEGQSVRMRTELLDRLVDMVGELVIAQSMVRQDPTLGRGDQAELVRKVAHSGKIVRELQELTMSLRMVPLKPTFQKLARVVRDTAQKSGKRVALVLEGDDTEIDRNMVDVIADPMVHMLRNAVDHGIESPAVRLASHKPETGTIRVSASHSGGSVVVTLSDDGAGLDRARIITKARERGLAVSDGLMTDSEVYNLIFEAGFSTRDEVTDVSGRGVGMDVVRRAVQALNGRIEITSTKGAGTTFTVRLPLTLAVTDGMLVRVGAERFIVPTTSIQTSVRPLRENLATVTKHGELLLTRGELIPMFRLARLFAIEGATEDPTRALAVVVSGAEGRCALLVDELLGQQQVVAKSLGERVGNVRGIAGGTILGDGRVGLILDTAEIIALAREGSGDREPHVALN